MVTSALFAFLAGFVTWVIDLWPDWEPPAWLGMIGDFFDGISYIHYFHAFIPLDAIFNAGVFLFACTVIATSISVGRITVSMFSGGGGAT